MTAMGSDRPTRVRGLLFHDALWRRRPLEARPLLSRRQRDRDGVGNIYEAAKCARRHLSEWNQGTTARSLTEFGEGSRSTQSSLSF